MHTGKAATMFFTAVLSTGVLMAQQAGSTQAPVTDATQATQSQRGHHADPDKQARRLAKKLGLSQDQVAQIKPILMERQTAMQSLKADASLNQTDRRAKARTIQLDSKNKIEAVLNDTQKQQFEQMLASRRAHHNQKHSS